MLSNEYAERRGLERRRSRRFVVRERRSGFERRARQGTPLLGGLDATLVYLRDHPVALMALLALGNVLSAVDAVLTLTLLPMGVIEANPLMSYLFQGGTAQALVFKCAVTAAASLGIWTLRRHRAALLAAVFFVGLYGALVIYEVFGLMHLV